MSSPSAEPTPSGAVPITPGLVVAFFLGAVGGLVFAVDWFVTLPMWLDLTALVFFAVGMTAYVYLSFKFARASGKSWFRVLLATLWAPIKFLFEFG
ncbi:hypothetical protein [Pengzhenrongella sp.]|jgi:hypothetical protein|uniref:hypothetical protein n=1 Tax=Pengzhenrongella sp. TaxID=2888820 RepID=UPI002F92C79B